MGISSKTRKVLWAKSDNRCAICQIELFGEKTQSEEVNIGEECHIISSKINGPRYKPDLSDYDNYDNLILLCRNHHKEIDELYVTFTEELLRYIKDNHENWVKNTLSNSIRKNENTKPKFLTRITSGKELLAIISESYGTRTDYDEIYNEEDAEYIGGVFQDLIDYGDLSGMVEISDKIKMGMQLNNLLSELEKKGYYLFGERINEKWKFKKDEEFENWPIATLIIKKKDSSEIINLNKNNTP